MLRCISFALVIAISLSLTVHFPAAPPATAPSNAIFSPDNLLAWCIVPFDAKKRSPEDRAAMLQRLGFTHYAYDWRAEHLPTFEREIDALARHHVELTAVWFPTSLDADARFILDTLSKRQIHTQLWVSAAGTPVKDEPDARKNVEGAAAQFRPIIEAAKRIGCTVALYNHGGWLGEPENELAVIDNLNDPTVGMVYNLHHGHDHVARLKDLLPRMKPRLVCITLNGMTADGEKAGKKILPIGEGELDITLLRTIRDSGCRGRLAILNHTDEDAEARLADNLAGLAWVVPQLDGAAAGPKPQWRSDPRHGK
jgi:sugar phosphate isomerase/epimerase